VLGLVDIGSQVARLVGCQQQQQIFAGQSVFAGTPSQCDLSLR